METKILNIIKYNRLPKEDKYLINLFENLSCTTCDSIELYSSIKYSENIVQIIHNKKLIRYNTLLFRELYRLFNLNFEQSVLLINNYIKIYFKYDYLIYAKII